MSDTHSHSHVHEHDNDNDNDTLNDYTHTHAPIQSPLNQPSALRRFVSTIRLPRSKKSNFNPTNPTNTLSPKPKPKPKLSSPNRYTPDLPPELWILIIQHATSPPLNPSTDPSSSSTTVSFLSHPHSCPSLPTHLTLMRQKSSLTLVSRAWHAYALPRLFEFVWLARARQARALARVLRSDTGTKGKDEGGVMKGGYIRRIHIETPVLERCSAADVRAILDYAPGVVVYSDYGSVRRRNVMSVVYSPLGPAAASSGTGTVRCPMGVGGVSSTSASTHTAVGGGGGSQRSHVITFSPCTDPASPDSLLAALARPGNSLRRLSWTNYDDLSFHLRLTPLLLATAANLEFLELNFCSQLESARDLGLSLNSNQSLNRSWDCFGVGGAGVGRGYEEAKALTLPALRALKVTLDNATFGVLATWDMPRLKNLSVLAADFSYYSARSVGGSGGAATNEHHRQTLSGFELFFLTHGEKVEQLELGHSSSVIEEHWVTAPPHPHLTPDANNATTTTTGRIPLSTWCPNLTTFICSADAEWNWQSPDWIAPHVLLPAHPGVRFIGIRDIGKRIVEGLRRGRVRGHGGWWEDGEGGEGLGLNRDRDRDLDGDFFVLKEQIGSLVRREAFPSLLYVRDMSYESDLLRRGGEFGEAGEGGGGGEEFAGYGNGYGYTAEPRGYTTPDVPSTRVSRRWPWSPTASSSGARATTSQGQSRLGKDEWVHAGRVRDRMRVLRFWRAVLERCREGGVWLEDWRGVNITVGDLRRAAVGYARGEVE